MPPQQQQGAPLTPAQGGPGSDIYVKTPDGAYAKFPAGTPKETIQAAMAKRYPPKQAAPKATAQEDMSTLQSGPGGKVAPGYVPSRGAPSLMEGVKEDSDFHHEKEALPYVAAGAATAALPEGAPIWQRLGMAGGGAAIGQGITDLAEHGIKRQMPTPQGAKDEVTKLGEAAVTKGAAPEAFGAGLEGMLKKLYGASPVPSWIQSYLKGKGITMTGGELAGPGALSTAENVTGAVAINTGITSNFELARQESYTRMLNERASEISQGLQEGPGDTLTIKQGSQPRNPQEVAQEALQRSKQVTDAAHERIADSVARGTNMTPAEAGDVVIQAVRGTYDEADNAVDDLYQHFKPQIEQQGYHGSWKQAATEARSIVQKAHEAQRMGGTALPPDLLTTLERISGRTEDANGTVTYSPPSGNFQAMWDARKSVGKMIGKLESQGVITNPQYAALKRMYGTMTDDMLKVLPAQLSSQFRIATSATAALKDKFNTDLLKSMLRHDQPAVAERVFDTVMRSGNETDLKSLTGIIGNNKEAMDSTRRAAITWIFKKSRNDEAALHLLEQRPGLKQLFGSSNYDGLVRELTERARVNATPAQRLEQKFLAKVTNIEDPQDLAKRMYKSPVYTEHVGQLLKNQPLIMQDMGVRTFNELIDDSTHNGPFGYPGSQFDPVKFSQNWARKRDNFKQFLAPEVIRNMDEMAGALGKLTFRPNQGVAAKFKTLAEVSAITSIGGTVLMGLLTGHPMAAAETGVIAPLIGVYGPRMFIKATLSPTGSHILAEGLKLQPGTAAATAWSARLLEYIGREAASDNGTPKFPATPPQAGAPAAHAPNMPPQPQATGSAPSIPPQ